MIVLTIGGTALADPSRRLIVPTKGPEVAGSCEDGMKPIYKPAGEIHRVIAQNIKDALAPKAVEDDRTLEYCQDCTDRKPMRLETPAERYRRMVPEWYWKVHPFASLSVDPFLDEPLTWVPNGPVVCDDMTPPHDASEQLCDLVGDYVNMGRIKQGHTFGNGVTCNSWIPVLNASGETRMVMASWCVLTPEWGLRYQKDVGVKRALWECMESGSALWQMPEEPVRRVSSAGFEELPMMHEERHGIPLSTHVIPWIKRMRRG